MYRYFNIGPVLNLSFIIIVVDQIPPSSPIELLKVANFSCLSWTLIKWVRGWSSWLSLGCVKLYDSPNPHPDSAFWIKQPSRLCLRFVISDKNLFPDVCIFFRPLICGGDWRKKTAIYSIPTLLYADLHFR